MKNPSLKARFIILVFAVCGSVAFAQTGGAPSARPKAAPPYIKILLGEYAFEDSVLSVLEIDGSLSIAPKGRAPSRFLQAGFRSFIQDGVPGDGRAELTFEGKPGIRPLYLTRGADTVRETPF